MKFCRMCGGKLEGDEDFCPYCGSKVLTAQSSPDDYAVKVEKAVETIQKPNDNHKANQKKNPVLIVLVILLTIICIGLLLFGNMKYKEFNGIIASKDTTINDLNLQIEGLNNEITGYKEEIADKIEGLNNLKKEKEKSDYKARHYDSIIAFAGTEGIGPESGSFCAEKSFLILRSLDPARKIKITTQLNGNATMDMSINGSAAKAQWDESSWKGTTTITVTPCATGVSTIKISNNVNSNIIKIIVIVV